MKIVAMIPARIGSQRLKYKNLALLNKKPLISHVIEKAQKSKIFSEIFINSDSLIFKQIAERHKINFFLRNKKYGKSNTKSDDVVINFLENIDCDYLVWVNPIAPLQQIDDMKKSVNIMLDKNYNTLMTVIEKQVHFLKGKKPINFKIEKKFNRTQELPKLSEMVYTLMMWNAKSFVKFYNKNHHAMLHGKIFFYTVNKTSALIVKNKEDLILIEAILNQKNKKINYDKILKKR